MEQNIEDECAVLSTLRIISKKWTTFIVSELLMKEGLYFSDLSKRIADKYGKKISARVLSDSLSLLEANGIVDRIIVQDKPVRVQYSISEKGVDLAVIYGALKGYGIKYGGVKYKKCQSFTCIHNAVPTLDIEKAKDLLYLKDPLAVDLANELANE
ncbi:MAG: winged helix-turn-helix transcriptional regulator [Candidatus Hodarchaeales archaeon]|jgi:DNA-binding HxlR family transcriptional regulator